MTKQNFTGKVEPRSKGGLLVQIPFDPNTVWGKKPRHLINGTIAGIRFRGEIEEVAGRRVLAMKPAWGRDSNVSAGDLVEVEISPEGPQRGALDPDVVEALANEPQAAAFFDGLAQFYRKAYLTWINSTKKRPEERARRLAEMIELLKAGKKERPK